MVLTLASLRSEKTLSISIFCGGCIETFTLSGPQEMTRTRCNLIFCSKVSIKTRIIKVLGGNLRKGTKRILLFMQYRTSDSAIMNYLFNGAASFPSTFPVCSNLNSVSEHINKKTLSIQSFHEWNTPLQPSCRVDLGFFVPIHFPFHLEFQIIRLVISTFTPIFFIKISFVLHPPPMPTHMN